MELKISTGSCSRTRTASS